MTNDYDPERIKYYAQFFVDLKPLTDKERAAIHLHRLGMSTRNIALALNISRSATRERIRNATRKLAKQENQ